MKTLRELLSNYANHQSATPSPLPLLMAIVDRLEPLRPPTVREQMADLFGLNAGPEQASNPPPHADLEALVHAEWDRIVSPAVPTIGWETKKRWERRAIVQCCEMARELDLRTSREPLLRALTAERDAAVKERDAIHAKLNAAREALR